MSKRRLTKQQRARITGTQTKRREQSHEKPEDDQHLGVSQPGLLMAHFGDSVEIEDNQGQIHRCAIRQNLPPLVVGDHVVWRAGKASMGVVTSMHVRESELVRYNSHGQKKIVAANLSQAMVVCAVHPEFSEPLLDSYLSAILISNIKPIIVLNKIDLLNESAFKALKARLVVYEKIGFTVCFISCDNDLGLNKIKDLLSDHVSVFVGQSGVGKSSLIKKFIDDESIAVGEISSLHKMGKHTTTTSRLYHLKTGGSLIDSPGVREFGLGKITSDELFDSFVELKPYKGQCKFRNCQHLHEPACALKMAVEKEEISKARFDSFRHLLASL